MRALAIASLLGLAACTAPVSENPAPRCTADGDCASAQHCYRGFCVSPDGQPDGGQAAAMCEEGRTPCGGECVELREDDHHCGRCDNDCGRDRKCHDGVCEEKDS